MTPKIIQRSALALFFVVSLVLGAVRAKVGA